MNDNLSSENQWYTGLFPRIVNRLSFRTNSHTIVPYLLSKKERTHSRSKFTLSALAECPKELFVPLTPHVVQLSLGNAALPILDECLRQRVVESLAPHYRGKLSPQELREAVERARHELDCGIFGQMEGDALRQSLDNHRLSGHFSHIDWCLDHWGCPEDIVAMVDSTFTVPTPGIEFTTVATPPILALQLLANTFPSVLFTLDYAAETGAKWVEVRFHPFPPFGY
jgi:hypothetical protein